MSGWGNWIPEAVAGRPTEQGWYAVIYCYDPHEGYFPDTNYWTGDAWSDETMPVRLWSPTTFADSKQARDWAYQNDLDV